MPNIPQYELPLGQSDIRTNTSGAEAISRAGGAVSRAARVGQETARSIGQYTTESWAMAGRMVAKGGEVLDNYITTKDIASAAEQHTALAAQSAKDLPAILAKADDPVKAAQDYYDNVWKPAADGINQNMTTKGSRRWATEHMAMASDHFHQNAIAEAMSITGAKTIAKFDSSIDNLGTAAHSDPHGVDNYAKQIDSIGQQMKPLLTPQQQVQFEAHLHAAKGNVYMAAGQALAEKNPHAFKQQLDGGWGKDYLSDTQRQQLSNYSHVMVREARSDAREASQDAAEKWQSKFYDPKTGDVVKITPEVMKQINADPSLRPQDKTRIIGGAMRAYKEQQAVNNGLEAQKNDAVTVHNLEGRMGDENNPLTHDQVDEAAQKGLISSKTAEGFHFSINQLNSADPKAREQVQSEKGADTVLKAMTKTNNPFAPPTWENAQKYEQGRRLLKEYIRQQKAGGMTNEDIFATDGKAYWAKQPQFQALQGDQTTDPVENAKKLLQQQQQGNGGGAGGAPAPAKPGAGVDKARNILNGK